MATAMKRRLVYFERWMDPVAEEVLGATPDVDLIRLSFDHPPERTWPVLESAHGYHVRPRLELRQQWFPNRPLIRRCPSLLAVSATGAGYDMIDVAACTEAGVLVVNNAGANADSVAQHVLGMMLALAKRIIESDRAVRRVAGIDRFDYVGRELTGRTVGIIGLGNVGRRVSALAGGLFGMRVLACDPYIGEADFRDRSAEPVDRETVFRGADFVSVNCPLTDETRGMIGARDFAAMRPDACFITTARGGIHDEAALAEALAAGRIAGAGLDVFADEPPGPDHPLAAFDNVVLTPHIAGVTDESNHAMARVGAEQWKTIFAGRRPPRLVNPEVWPRYKARHERLTGRPMAE